MSHLRGNRIRALRESRSWTGQELAQRVHISPQYLYDLEKGTKRLNEDILASLAEVFQVSTDYLLGRTDDPTPPSDEHLTPEEYDRRVVAALSRSDGYGEPLSKEEIEDILKYIQWTREKHRMDKERKSDS